VHQGTIRGIICRHSAKQSAIATVEYLFNTGRKLKATNAMHGIMSYIFTVSETYNDIIGFLSTLSLQEVQTVNQDAEETNISLCVYMFTSKKRIKT
jgi:hypothetical protein